MAKTKDKKVDTSIAPNGAVVTGNTAGIRLRLPLDERVKATIRRNMNFHAMELRNVLKTEIAECVEDAKGDMSLAGAYINYGLSVWRNALPKWVFEGGRSEQPRSRRSPETK